MDHTLEQLQSLCGQLGIPLPAQHPVAPPEQKPAAPPAAEPVLYQPTNGIDCWCPCDFRQLPVEAGNVKLVATDIPYDAGWLRHVPDFAEWCAEKLADEGVLVTFYGQSHLDEMVHLMRKRLVYRWQLHSPIYGVARSYGRFVARYQLAVVFSKREDWHPRQAVADIMPAGVRVPGDHPHRKTVSQMQFIVEAFSDENSLVVDPCAGGWTTAIACQMMCRRFVGSEIEAKWMAVAEKRFGGLLSE